MPQYELNIRDYLRIVRRRKWTIVLSFILILLLTIFYTNKQVPVYQTSTTVKIEQRTTFTGLLAEYFSYNPGDVIATEQNIITSYKVLEEVARQMGLINESSSPQEIEKEVNRLMSMVSTEKIESSNVIRIKVVSDNPAKAAAVANTVARVYADVSFAERNKETMEARRFIEDQLITVESRLRDAEENLRRFQESGKASGAEMLLKDKLANLKVQLSTFLDKYTENHPSVIKLREQIRDMEGRLKGLPTEEIEFSRLKREVSINEESYDLLNKKYKEALITESQKFSPVTILNPAPEPTAPIKPNKPLNVMVGTIVGLMLGFIIATIRENLDTSIGTIEEVEEYLRLPVLGLIPHIQIDEKRFKGLSPREEKEARLQANLVLQYDPKSVFAEAYRTLQTNIKISRLKEGNKKILLITSATSNEGKTITAANYAVAAAQAGAKVLLIDLDLRKPILHRIFGVQREPGITDVIIGNVKLEESLRGVSDFLVGGLDVDHLLRTQGVENLRLLPAGFISPNPTTILNSMEFTELLQRFKDEFDIIILDCPPVIPVADAIILGGKVDAVILVYQVGRVARGALKRSATQLTNANASILGVVLNEIRAGEMEMGHAYYYYYYKSYKEESKNWWEKLKGWITGRRG